MNRFDAVVKNVCCIYTPLKAKGCISHNPSPFYIIFAVGNQDVKLTKYVKFHAKRTVGLATPLTLVYYYACIHVVMPFFKVQMDIFS